MNELFNHYKKTILIFFVPYLVVIFLLFFPIDLYLQTPGGLSEVEKLVEVDYQTEKETSGSISSTYIMSITRPSFYEFIIGYFNPYSSFGILTGSSLDYTNEEIAEISYLDKETSVDAAIIVAYTEAQKYNTEIQIEVEQVIMVYGKAVYLDHYAEINFGDEFVQLVGDFDEVITTIEEISAATQLSKAYDFTFRNEITGSYTVNLSKDETTNLFGITLKNYYLVNEDNTYPSYTVNDSNIGGPSGGLLQTLAIYNMLSTEDITHGYKIAGTGTINYDGSVGYIGGVKQKIATAYLNGVDYFFMPYLDEDYYYDNYLEALRACEELGINPEGWLIPVSSFSDAIDFLNSLGGTQ